MAGLITPPHPKLRHPMKTLAPTALPLPLPPEVYSQLPASLKLLSWHIASGDESAFAAYLQGKGGKVSVKATRLWFQDYTGVPEIVNLAAKRDALAALGKNPGIIRAMIPTHMAFDHSVRTKGNLAENRADELRLNLLTASVWPNGRPRQWESRWCRPTKALSTK